MLTWTDDEGVVHRALANTRVTVACGKEIASALAAATFAVDTDDDAVIVTCVWCVIGKPQGIKEAVVLAYNERFNTRVRNALDAQRSRPPTRKRAKRA